MKYIVTLKAEVNSIPSDVDMSHEELATHLIEVLAYGVSKAPSKERKVRMLDCTCDYSVQVKLRGDKL